MTTRNVDSLIEFEQEALAGARRWLDKVENHEAPLAPLTLVGARTAVEMRETRLARLEDQREAQHARRVAGEETIAPTVKTRAKELQAARARVVSAVEAAQNALLGLADAATEYDATIREQAAELAAAGVIGAGDGVEMGSDPRSGLVILAGQVWQTLTPAAVLSLVAERVQLARFDPRNFYRACKAPRGHTPERMAHALVAEVPLPQPVGYRNPLVEVEREPITSPVITKNGWR